MPRDGSGIYTQPLPDVVPATTIASTVYNGFVNDVETDLNQPRPIIAGGTGGSSAAGARASLQAERSMQLVANYDTQVWEAGSFSSAAGATSAPVAAHAFTGIAYGPDATHMVIEARDQTDTPPGVVYVRTMTAGVWNAWMATGAPNILGGIQVNGSFEISQEKGNGSTALVSGNSAYVLDQWQMHYSCSGAVISGQMGGCTIPGLRNSLLMNTGTSGLFTAAGDLCRMFTPIEGYRIACLGMGAAGALPFTIGFYVYAGRTGRLSVGIQNSDMSRSYLANIDVAASSTWEWHTVTIPGDTVGTWYSDSRLGMVINISSLCGSTYQGAAGSWGAGVKLCTSDTVNFMNVNGTTLAIAGFGVWPGTQAPAPSQVPFLMRSGDQELVTCKRYWQKIGGDIANDVVFTCTAVAAGQLPTQTHVYSVEMRNIPVQAFVGTWNIANANIITPYVGRRSMTANLNCLGAGPAYYAGAAGAYISLNARF